MEHKWMDNIRNLWAPNFLSRQYSLQKQTLRAWTQMILSPNWEWATELWNSRTEPQSLAAPKRIQWLVFNCRRWSKLLPLKSKTLVLELDTSVANLVFGLNCLYAMVRACRYSFNSMLHTDSHLTHSCLVIDRLSFFNGVDNCLCIGAISTKLCGSLKPKGMPCLFLKSDKGKIHFTSLRQPIIMNCECKLEMFRYAKVQNVTATDKIISPDSHRI